MNAVVDLTELAKRVEGLAGEDREVDLEIHLLAWPASDIADIVKRHPRGLGKEGYAWDIWQNGCVVVEKRTSDGACPYNAGYQLPAYTASLDAAMTLVPEGATWTIGSGIPKLLKLEPKYTAARPWARIDKNQGRPDCVGFTPALALTAAALRARARLQEPRP